MKRRAIATTVIGLLACSTPSMFVCAADDPSHSVSTQTDVTLKAGSGENPEPIISDDTHDDHPGTKDKGALTIPFASNITFGEQEIKQGDTDYYALNKKPYVQVNDTRGGAKGWKLGVSISPFTGADGKALRGAKLSLLNGKIVTDNNKSLPPKVSSPAIELNKDTQDVMVAQTKQGAGAFAVVFEGKDNENQNVKLHVPRAGLEAQNYTAQLTWVLTDGPV